VPGQAGAAFQQDGLVGLDDEQVVGLLSGDQELGGVGVGLQRVGGDHHPGQVEPVQQRGERGDLFGGAGDLALGQHRAAGVVHTGQQVDRAAVGGGPFGAAQGLAVDGDRPSAGGGSATLPLSLLVCQPGADGAGQGVGIQARQSSADAGLGRDGGGRQAQDGHQRVAAATGSSRVRDAGQAGKQVQGVRGRGRARRGRVGPGRLGSGMMGRRARASVRVTRLWVAARSWTFVPAFTLRHHVTNQTHS
jgi:hypothetical protein